MKKNFNIKNLKSILITGISGSGGSYLAEYIYKKYPHIKINGISRWHSTTNNENLSKIKKNIILHNCDLNDYSSSLNVLKKIKPQIIFNLASHANVRDSFNNPISVINNNINSTLNLFETVRFLKLDTIILHCSTSEVYGLVSKKDVPINENQPLKPASPYALSKVTQDLMAQTYFRNYGMKIIITRMFTYLNPKREDLFSSSFAKQIAEIEQNKKNILMHGNLESIRTIIDHRDAMKSYFEAAYKCKFGEVYNLGGSRVISVKEFLSKLIKLSKSKIITKLDKQLLRPTDVTLQIPDTNKFEKQTNFKNSYDVDSSVLNLLNFWRDKIKYNG